MPLRSSVSDFCLDFKIKQGDSQINLPSHRVYVARVEAKEVSVEYIWQSVVKYGHYITPLHISWIDHPCWERHFWQLHNLHHSRADFSEISAQASLHPLSYSTVPLYCRSEAWAVSCLPCGKQDRYTHAFCVCPNTALWGALLLWTGLCVTGLVAVGRFGHFKNWVLSSVWLSMPHFLFPTVVCSWRSA